MIKGALIGFGISILLLMIPIVHFVAGPIGPFIGGFIGGGVARATPSKAVTIGLLMGLFMAGPAVALVLLVRVFSSPDWVENVVTFVAVAMVLWMSVLGTLGALFAARSRRFTAVRRPRW